MRYHIGQFHAALVQRLVPTDCRWKVGVTGRYFRQMTLAARGVTGGKISEAPRCVSLIQRLCAVGLLGAGLGFAAVASDEAAIPAPKLTFSIPEQPLVTALQAYSAVSGVHVLYESGAEVGQRSSAVHGEFTREVALKILLGKSNLVVRYARADSVALVDPTAQSPDEPPEALQGSADMALDTLHVVSPQNGPDRNALAEYMGVIQQDVQQALRKGGKTSSGSYRVGVDLWVDPSRTIRKTEVFRSTGDRERDVAVSEVLQGLVIRQSAPARTPQPVRVMIVVRSF